MNWQRKVGKDKGRNFSRDSSTFWNYKFFLLLLALMPACDCVRRDLQERQLTKSKEKQAALSPLLKQGCVLKREEEGMEEIGNSLSC